MHGQKNIKSLPLVTHTTGMTHLKEINKYMKKCVKLVISKNLYVILLHELSSES